MQHTSLICMITQLKILIRGFTDKKHIINRDIYNLNIKICTRLYLVTRMNNTPLLSKYTVNWRKAVSPYYTHKKTFGHINSSPYNFQKFPLTFVSENFFFQFTIKKRKDWNTKIIILEICGRESLTVALRGEQKLCLKRGVENNNWSERAKNSEMT
jgi:hypothetical protein